MVGGMVGSMVGGMVGGIVVASDGSGLLGSICGELGASGSGGACW